MMKKIITLLILLIGGFSLAQTFEPSYGISYSMMDSSNYNLSISLSQLVIDNSSSASYRLNFKDVYFLNLTGAFYVVGSNTIYTTNTTLIKPLVINQGATLQVKTVILTLNQPTLRVDEGILILNDSIVVFQ
jgi:hypothetical protein